MKKNIYLVLTIFCLITFSFNASASNVKKLVDPTYEFILSNNGCFYLYRVYDFGEVSWIEPVQHFEWAGTTSFCPYSDVMEDMC